jgi:hypothetical protein
LPSVTLWARLDMAGLCCGALANCQLTAPLANALPCF